MSEDPIARLNETLEGRYAVERRLGEGGMATVYLADDLKHNRKVALKVLKPELAAVVGAERFLAEIETTANLQHPHILPLFDSGEAGSFLYYVMPYVEGESLMERLGRERQLPVDEAVKIATDLAEALDYAHRRGVIHRDIKPANIMMHEGRPLIADFGIAIAVGAAGGSRLTETGLSVGTPYYMSPEQATGDQNVGPQSDTYALACVLFEMLTGDPPFPGSTAQAVLGKIIAGEPVSATKVRATVPHHVDAAVRRALEKLPADRFTSAQEFAQALADEGFRHGDALAGAAVGGGGAWNRLTTAFAAVAGVAVIALGILATRPEASAPVIRYTLMFPDDQLPVPAGQGAFGVSLALSPDGSRMVYVGDSDSGVFNLWLRERNRLEASPIRGTEDGFQPFFSPDGTRVGYISNDAREIKIVSLSGEPPLTAVEGGIYRLGASWGADGYLYFVQLETGGLARVPVSGGEIEPISAANADAGETRHAWPSVLPNGRGVLVTVMRGDNVYHPEDDVGVVDVETGELHVLFRGILGRYTANGHIVFVTHDGDLVAAPFDQDRFELTGPTVPLLSGVPGAIRGPDVAISTSGRLVYSPVATSAGFNPVWVDRAGRVTPVEPDWTVTPATQSGPALSPDGRRIALSLTGAGGSEVWVKELDGPFSRLAFQGDHNVAPTWSPDGRNVLWASNRLESGTSDLFMRRADGSSGDELFLDIGPRLTQAHWSRDGEWLVAQTELGAESDIVAMRIGVDSVPEPIIASEFGELAPAISPDGRHIAYVSVESGFTEVYVRPFPNVGDSRTQISSDGGREPVWAHSGRELFYKNNQRQLVAVGVSTENDFEVVSRTPLFTIPLGDTYNLTRAFYDVTPDDQTFLALQAAGSLDQDPTGQFIVVENFLEELKDRVGN